MKILGFISIDESAFRNWIEAQLDGSLTQRCMRAGLVFFLIISTSSLTLTLMEEGSTARFVQTLCAVAFTLAVCAAIREFVFSTPVVEPGVAVSIAELPGHIDEVTVCGVFADQELKMWFLMVTAQGSSDRRLVWALKNQIRTSNGRKIIQHIHPGWSFSRQENEFRLLLYNVRGLPIDESAATMITGGE